MTDEPDPPPIPDTLDALRYMMARLHKPAPERLPPTIVTSELSLYQWRDEFNLTDEQMKVIGYDAGSKSTGTIYVTTWTPDGLRYTEIPTEDFYMPYPLGGNIGGNASEVT